MHRSSAVLLAVMAGVGLYFHHATAAPVAGLDSGSGEYDIVAAPEMFEGDIAGFPIEKRVTSGSQKGYSIRDYPRNAVLDMLGRWANGVVPYVISERFTESEVAQIERAIEEINNITAGLFLVHKEDQHENSVFVARGGPNTGCWSYVGVIGGQQTLNLEVAVNQGDPHCMHHGIIEHEFLHAIGLWHEQSRTDRNDHVEINWDNIHKNQQHNFAFYTDDEITHFDQPYDYDSLMHYGKYDFAIDRSEWTIRPKEPHHDTPIGQRRGLSPVDIAKLDLMYPAPTAPDAQQN
ncbi:high choriolytic enzyme 1-like [Paramacrobiotus metropolitanus]|uniref:high choriolytic enzyme 1-like n=1 Tax=Paramacrobiotus metropolitanus TaxID=2943436 RepID=UPI0024456447|nr:high choriolytic enzyme 1-like [Paramacrobiotus metropolitanus]